MKSLMTSHVSLGETPNSPYIFRGFRNTKNSAVCTEFPICSKLHFSEWKTNLSQFFDKLLNMR